MALNSIKVVRTRDDAVEHFPAGGTSIPLRGELCRVDAAGTLEESAGAVGTGAIISHLGGVCIGPVAAAEENPRTGAAYAAGDLIPMVKALPGVTFSTENFNIAGVAFADVPLAAHVGDEGGLSLISGDWGVDLDASENTIRIVKVLDSLGRNVSAPGAGAGVTVWFEFVESQWLDDTAPAA